MSDTAFESPDSQAAWAALGDRMRRNRMWLLLMLMTLGLYLAAQTWSHLRREGMGAHALAGNVAPDGAVPAPADGAAPTGSSDVAGDDATGDGASSPYSPSRAATGAAAPSPATEAQVARARTREITSGRALEPSRSLSPSAATRRGTEGPINSTTSQHKGEPLRSAAGRPGGVTRASDLLSTPNRAAPSSASQPGQGEAFGETLGGWLVRWHQERERSRREGLRMAASTVASYVKMPKPKQLPVSVAEPRETATTATTPPARSPSDASRATAATSKHPSPDVNAAHSAPAAAGPAFAGSAPSATRPPLRYAGLSLRNPRTSGGAVHYLVNGREHTLRPGESQELPTGRWLVEFHRGGDFGDAASMLAGGSYRFEITAAGWALLRGE